MFDIITFGSASRDIIVKPKNVTVLKYHNDFGVGKGICLPLGSKLDVDDIQFYSGGGGTNTAATFAKQGFKTAFLGVVGEDDAGIEVIHELKKLNIYTDLVLTTNKKKTNQSIIILNNGQDRTILVFRGASDLVRKKEIPWKKLQSKWFYVAPLSGLFCGRFEEIINFAYQNNIKIAVNPSMQQLSLPKEKLEKMLKKIDVLILNQEEASFLTKIPFEKEKEIFKKIDDLCPGVTVMTKGGEGVIVSDNKYLYSAKPLERRKIADTTGAGDSFAAGFLTDYIRHNGNLEKAIQLGMANAVGNLSQIGAKNGLLKKGHRFEPVTVVKNII